MKKKIIPIVMALAMIFSMTTMAFGSSKHGESRPPANFTIYYQGNNTVVTSKDIKFSGSFRTNVKEVKVNNRKLEQDGNPGWVTHALDENKLTLRGVKLKPNDRVDIEMKNKDKYRFTYSSTITASNPNSDGSNTAATTYFTFDLSEPIPRLTLEDLIFTSGENTVPFVATGLSVEGNTYKVAISDVTDSGSITMSLNKPGYKLKPETLTFNLVGQPPVNYNVAVSKSDYQKTVDKEFYVYSEATADDFNSIEVDGITVRDYIFKDSHDTVILLSDEFMNSLEPGTHTVKINSKRGSGTATFNVIPAPVIYHISQGDGQIWYNHLQEVAIFKTNLQKDNFVNISLDNNILQDGQFKVEQLMDGSYIYIEPEVLKNLTPGSYPITINGQDGYANTSIVVKEPVMYQLTSNLDNWINGYTDQLKVSTSADSDKFVALMVDGVKVAANQFLTSDSTSDLELTNSFLAELSNGVHKIDIISNDGIASGEFNVMTPLVYDLDLLVPLVWYKGSTDGLQVVSAADYNKFKEVKVNGTALTSDQFTVSAGSTSVNINPDFLDSLQPGTSSVEIISKDGKATYDFDVKEPVVYELGSQVPLIWTKGSTEDLQVVSVADYNKFKEVKVNGTALTNGQFTVVAGSTSVSISHGFLEQLELGSHTVEIISNDGKAAGTFTVIEQPIPEPQPQPDPTPVEPSMTEPSSPEISNPDSIIYKILSWTNQNWVKGKYTSMIIKSEAPFKEFKAVYINQTLVSPENYSLSEGSTIVEIQGSFLNTLPLGENSIRIESSKGSATGTFTVANEEASPVSNVTKSPTPKTGDTFDALFCVALLVLSCGTAMAMTVRRNKE